MNENQQKQLGATLWGIANKLRGAMNADDFRDYMLSFLFLRYLSDNYEEAVKKELGKDYFDLKQTEPWRALALWYNNNKDDVAEFEKRVVLNEFALINQDGQMLYGLKESIIRAIGLCVFSGLLWFLFEGEDRTPKDFAEGFFMPFVYIILSSVFGLPVYFIGKKKN